MTPVVEFQIHPTVPWVKPRLSRCDWLDETNLVVEVVPPLGVVSIDQVDDWKARVDGREAIRVSGTKLDLNFSSHGSWGSLVVTITLPPRQAAVRPRN